MIDHYMPFLFQCHWPCRRLLLYSKMQMPDQKLCLLRMVRILTPSLACFDWDFFDKISAEINTWLLCNSMKTTLLFLSHPLIGTLFGFLASWNWNFVGVILWKIPYCWNCLEYSHFLFAEMASTTFCEGIPPRCGIS